MPIQQHLHTRMPGQSITRGSSLLIVSLLVVALQLALSPLASAHSLTAKAVQHVSYHAGIQQSRHTLHNNGLAPTVQVLNALPPTFILQFPLSPSGIKALFPQATALVTVVRGDRDNSTSDTVTVDVQHMPPNITFTIFFIELANKPFGHVEYVADLTTRGDGSGESVFQLITNVAFAMDARNPGASNDNIEGLSTGIQLEHMGMWFASLQDAQRVLNNPNLTGTIFDGGNPPLHAGPQAMTDGQTLPVM
ncbi:MAG: hypothetical protein ACJ8AG_10080 [Ktedonobacteraceae bacterium]